MTTPHLPKIIPQCDHNVRTCDCSCAACSQGTDCPPTCEPGSSTMPTTHTCSDGVTVTCYSGCSSPPSVSPTCCDTCGYMDPATGDIYKQIIYSANYDSGWVDRGSSRRPNYFRTTVVVEGTVTQGLDEGGDCRMTIDSSYASYGGVIYGVLYQAIGVVKSYSGGGTIPTTLPSPFEIAPFAYDPDSGSSLPGGDTPCQWRVPTAYPVSAEALWDASALTISYGSSYTCCTSGLIQVADYQCCPTAFTYSTSLQECVWAG